MPATVNGGGDQLARGAVRATFRSANVSQEKWDSIWGADGGPKKNYSEPQVEAKPQKIAPTSKRKKK